MHRLGLQEEEDGSPDVTAATSSTPTAAAATAETALAVRPMATGSESWSETGGESGSSPPARVHRGHHERANREGYVGHLPALPSGTPLSRTPAVPVGPAAGVMASVMAVAIVVVGALAG